MKSSAFQYKNYGKIGQRDLNRIKDLANEIEYDSPVLKNLLNNVTKKNMILWRTEERHHLGINPKIGDIIQFEGFNSTAISREGAEYFASVSNRDFVWMYEIEAPAGTKGAYVAPKAATNNSHNFKMEMKYLLQEDTKMEIIEFDEINHYARLRIVK